MGISIKRVETEALAWQVADVTGESLTEAIIRPWSKKSPGWKSETGVAWLNRDMARVQIEVVAVTAEQAYGAAEARCVYGKGRHDPDLNYGDSFAHALAKFLDEPLLFKGNGFIHTDIKRVVA